MKVLYCTSEAFPFAGTGGLGDVAGSLPKALTEKGVECSVVLPLYSAVKAQFRDQMKFLCHFDCYLGWRKIYCGVFTLQYQGVDYYFLDNEFYFKRDGIYSFFDDGERFAFFSKAILDMIKYTEYTPDILHCNDWQTALVSVYLNSFYRDVQKLSKTKTVFTIHNIQYQGRYDLGFIQNTLGFNQKDNHILEFGGGTNLMKAAIYSSDKITTVSPTYAKEILDPWYSHGLDGMLKGSCYKLCGILNGIDTQVYNPSTDKFLAKTYTEKTVTKNKAICKKDIREIFGLEQNEQPIVGMVTRLVSHKGIDIVKHILENIVNEGVQFVLLGSGEYEYEQFFSQMAVKYPGKVGVKLGFIPELAHKIYAGVDMFLMPSKSEPCGLAQMVSARYGTVPIVRETGGLADSITDSSDFIGIGFTFKSYNSHDLFGTIQRAKGGYYDEKGWEILIKRNMATDFSWGVSAEKYKLLYEETLHLW